jgi:hypothetical protein
MLLERAGTRRRHDGHCATYAPPVNGTLESTHYGGRTTNRYVATLEAAPVPAQDAPRRPGWGGFARTAVNSMALLAMPPRVGKQCGTHVNCSLLGL